MAFNAKTNVFAAFVIKNDTIAQHLLPFSLKDSKGIGRALMHYSSNTFFGGRSSITGFTKAWYMSRIFCKMLSTPNTSRFKDCYITAMATQCPKFDRSVKFTPKKAPPWTDFGDFDVFSSWLYWGKNRTEMWLEEFIGNYYCNLYFFLY